MKDYKLQIQPEAYAINYFKVIWDRDKTKDKSIAVKELAYIYYMTDYASDFLSIMDENDRDVQVKKACSLDSKWKPDKVILDAINFYNERQQTIKLGLLQDARSGIKKLSKYLKDINFDEVIVGDKGDVKPKHDIKKYADTIRQIPSILQALDDLEEAVKKERDVQKGLRGGREKPMYAD